MILNLKEQVFYKEISFKLKNMLTDLIYNTLL